MAASAWSYRRRAYTLRWITSRLGQHLGAFSEEHRLGTVVTEALFIFDPIRNLRRPPDLAFVSTERWPLDRPIPKVGDWEVVPDLAMEVISPNEFFEELLVKRHEYFAKGVRQVWIVVPEVEQVFVFDSPKQVQIFNGTDELQGGSLLPGFPWAASSSAKAKRNGLLKSNPRLVTIACSVPILTTPHSLWKKAASPLQP